MPSFITLTAHTEAPGSLPHTVIVILLWLDERLSFSRLLCYAHHLLFAPLKLFLPHLNSLHPDEFKQRETHRGTSWTVRDERFEDADTVIICRIVPYSELYVSDWILHVTVLWKVYFLNLKVTLRLSVCTQLYVTVTEWTWIYCLIYCHVFEFEFLHVKQTTRQRNLSRSNIESLTVSWAAPQIYALPPVGLSPPSQ